MTDTKEKTVTHVAGVGFDALIAEKVMGWTWEENSARHPEWGRYSRRNKDDWSFLPRYSTSIEAVWHVVEKLRQDGVYANIGPDPSSDGYNASLFWHGDGVDEAELMQVNASAPTAPLAICLAALKVIESEDANA